MGYNIYYMYNTKTEKGYIGLNTYPNDYHRIWEHYDAFLKPKKNKKGKEAYDGGAQLVRDAGEDYLWRIRVKVFKDDTYGIPEGVYNKFLETWSLNGKNEWGKLSKGEKLDLAEFMHILAPKLQGNQWNYYNLQIGGFSTKRPDVMKVLQYTLTPKQQKILSKAYKKFGIPNPGQQVYEISSAFQTDHRVVINPENKKETIKDNFSKILYPEEYLISKAYFQEKIEKIVGHWFDQFVKTLFDNRKSLDKFSDAFSNGLKEKIYSDLTKTDKELESIKNLLFKDYKEIGKDIKTLKINAHKKKTNINQTPLRNKQIVEEMVEALRKVSHDESENLLNEINKKIRGLIRGLPFSFTWELDADDVKNVIDNYFNKIKELSFDKLISIFTLPAGRGKSLLDISSSVTIPISFKNIIRIEKQNSTLPEWAKMLKQVKFLKNMHTVGDPVVNSSGSFPGSSLKEDICLSICKKLFPVIEKVKATNYTQISQESLLSKFYDKVKKNRVLNGFDWDFCRLLIDIWHEYKYGPKEWVRLGETKEKAELPYQKYWFIQRTFYEENIKNESDEQEQKNFDEFNQIKWYWGSFYETFGVDQTLEGAAKKLAEKWTW